MCEMDDCERLVEEMKLFLEGKICSNKIRNASCMSSNVSKLVLFKDNSVSTTKPLKKMDLKPILEIVIPMQQPQLTTPEQYIRASQLLHQLLSSENFIFQEQQEEITTNEEETIVKLCKSTTTIEQQLASICLLHSKEQESSTNPRILRDLLESKPIINKLSPQLLSLLHLLVGPPIGLNLRNISWHGFLGLGEFPKQYISLLEAIIHEISLTIPLNAPKRSIINLSSFKNKAPQLLGLDSLPPTNLEWEFISKVLLPNSFFVIGGRESLFEKGLYSLWIGNEHRNDNISFGLTLLLPQLEHCLRRIFIASNNNLLIPSSTLSPDYRRYYTTLDIILAECVVVIKSANSDGGQIQLVAKNSTFGTRLSTPKFSESPSPRISSETQEETANGLRNVLGDGILSLLHDLLLHSDGPRIRDVVSHGTLDFSSVPKEITIGMVCSVIISLCIKFSSQEIIKQTPQRLLDCFNAVNFYHSKFHPVAISKDKIHSYMIYINEKIQIANQCFSESTTNEAIRECISNRNHCNFSNHPLFSISLLNNEQQVQLCTLYCSNERISTSNLCCQLAERSFSTVNFIVDKFKQLSSDITSGKCSRRAQTSLWKLSGCIDTIISICRLFTEVALFGLLKTDCLSPSNLRFIVSKSIRKCIDAIDKVWSKVNDFHWDEAISNAIDISFLPISELQQFK